MTRDFAARFWSKVFKTDECWYWLGQTDSKGYGVYKPGEAWFGTRRAPRLALLLSGVEIPAGNQARHICDDPLCVNPAHLRVGSNQDNVNDREERGRGSRPDQAGSANSQAKVTESIVVEIRRLAEAGSSIAELARRFSVSPGCVGGIVKRRRWAHVE